MSSVSFLWVCALLSATRADYWAERSLLIGNESSRMLGNDLVLNAKEEVVNEYLMKMKLTEYDEGFEEPGRFLPARRFLEARAEIERSEVFRFLQQVPKGGLLHTHEIVMLSLEGTYNMTYEKNLYVCTVANRLIKLKFLEDPRQDQSCDWQLLEKVRDPTYNSWLRSQLTLDPTKSFDDINQLWSAFSDFFGMVTPMITYRPFLEKYLYNSLKELYEDKVTYVEIRTTLPTVYELDGKQYSPIATAEIIRSAADAFKRDHPDFIGAKLIYAPERRVSKDKVKYYVELANELRRLYPDFVVGFDLVGQEDKGKPLAEFVDELQNLSKDIGLAYHAAETNWYGSTTDQNLFDAILLGTKRIGHGFSITKHPLVTELVKERQIAVEICPISNQMLMLVRDLRNHPAAELLGRGVAVVIGNDDPTFWNAKGLSYDFYVMFMGVASRGADLRLLKKLAENSLRHSFLPDAEKWIAIQRWNDSWNQFIDSTYTKVVGQNFSYIKASTRH